MTGIDLHTHSVRSDGTNTVTENVALARERGLAGMAVTGQVLDDKKIIADAAKAALQGFVNMGIFIGQSRAFFDLVNDLAEEADEPKHAIS